MPDETFTRNVLRVAAQIPPGRVMSYGEVGIAVGVEAPRAVGRVLALYGHAVPWWRVIRASGDPPQGHARLALPHYREEGTPLRGDVKNFEYKIEHRARLPFTHEIFGEVPL
ncbi:MAG: MGMT family protein [Canibacter sp.]